MTYNQAEEAIWRSLVDESWENDAHRIRELVRCATLAPSSHNTQCWKFRVSDGLITVLPDFSRRCPAVDPDDHHLYVTLGCAVENLVLTARALGINAVVNAMKPSEGIKIDITKTCTPEITPLFEAIPDRKCTRTEYNGQPLTSEELELLRKAGTGKGVCMLLFTNKEAKDSLLGWIQRANAKQMNSTEFKDELEYWIRFNDEDAVATGDGLPARAMGNPSTPKWLGHLILKACLRAGPENEKIRRQITSSAGIAVFVSDNDDTVHWVEAGRCYERFALQATALGVKTAFLNQPVEDSETRPRFAAEELGLSVGRRPSLIVRFGRGGPERPHSLRRPLKDVMME
jgi:hypothetical protein